MQYLNKHLVEVNCGFQFNKETTPWDSTFFGRFYEKILSKGFTGKEERKGVQLKFEITKNNASFPSTEIDDQVIFKNSTGMAILMAKNKISFHMLSNYTVWENFVNSLIIPFSEHYKSLGLGNGERQCNIVYLNRFTKNRGEDLSDYFKIVSPVDKSLGEEANTVVQKVLDNGTNLLIAKFSAQLVNTFFNINLECGAVNKDISEMNSSDWIQQANKTHAPVKDFFESIITNKLRQEL